MRLLTPLKALGLSNSSYKTTSHSKPGTPPPATTTLSTLPELLELIFSYLGPACLRYTISLVCQQWRIIARPLILRRLYWNPHWFTLSLNSNAIDKGAELTTAKRKRFKDILATLEHVQVLQVQLLQKPVADSFGPRVNLYENKENDMDVLWDEFLKRFKDLAKENKLLVRDLALLNAMEVGIKVLPILDCLPGLRRLRLENITTKMIPLGQIFESCPRLQCLEIEAHNSTTTVLNSVATLVESAGTEELGLHSKSNRTVGLPARLGLRTLRLRQIRVSEELLRRLLKACPGLLELGLLFIKTRTYSGGFGSDAMVEMELWRNLYQDISGLCPLLESFDYSTLHTVEDVTMMIPGLTGIGVFGTILTKAGAFDFLTTHLDRLTTLKIHGPLGTGRHQGKGDLLHVYLCQAPLLLHLYAPNVELYMDLLDLNHYMSISGRFLDRQYDSRETVLQARIHHRLDRKHQIWACRNLRTLHVIFARRGVDVGTAESSRLLFGYLSKVVPHLEELNFERGLLVLTLEGGLCLLQRMHGLRRLLITTGYTQTWSVQDFDWMARASWPGSAKDQIKKTKTLFGYAMAERKVLNRMPVSVQPPVVPTVKKPKRFWQRVGGSEGGRKDGSTAALMGQGSEHDGIQMKNVGLLSDLISLIREKEAGKWTCWPELESFEIIRDRGHFYGDADLNAIVGRIRPDIRFSYHDMSR